MTNSHRPPQEPASAAKAHSEGAPREGADPEGTARFRRTLARVMTMQVAALVALWWLQARYGN